ncbi:MAG: TraR/DksA C4-type zinc finger protein [Nitrospinota bacterium]
MRKSDKEKIKKALLKMRTAIVAEAERASSGEIETLEEERSDIADRSALETDRNFTLRLLDRDRKLMKKIDDSINRLESDDYGLCSGCGENIAVERLLARPVATLCISCKEEEEETEDSLP